MNVLFGLQMFGAAVGAAGAVASGNWYAAVWALVAGLTSFCWMQSVKQLERK